MIASSAIGLLVPLRSSEVDRVDRKQRRGRGRGGCRGAAQECRRSRLQHEADCPPAQRKHSDRRQPQDDDQLGLRLHRKAQCQRLVPPRRGVEMQIEIVLEIVEPVVPESAYLLRAALWVVGLRIEFRIGQDRCLAAANVDLRATGDLKERRVEPREFQHIDAVAADPVGRREDRLR